MSDATPPTPPTPPAAPAAVNPLDMALARIEALVTDLEKQHDQAEAQVTVPDDVPRFITRHGR